MSDFTTGLVYTRLTDKWVRVDQDVKFYFTLEEVFRRYPEELAEIVRVTGIPKNQKLWVIAPRGFVTDLASIPKFMHFLFKPDGPWAKAAVIHDILYQVMQGKFIYDSELGYAISRINAEFPRLMADRIFKMGMQVLGVDAITLNLMYEGVRLGGGFTFRKSTYETVQYFPSMNYKFLGFYQRSYQVIREEGGHSIANGDDLQWTSKDHVLIQYRNLKRPLLFNSAEIQALRETNNFII